jgi:CRP-like cAMP-binding protein
MQNNIVKLTQDFFEQFATERFEVGDTLISEHITPQDVYYIISGKIAQYDIANDGNKVTINIFAKGTLLSVMWLLTDNPNRCRYEVLQNTVVRRAPKEKVLQFLEDNPVVTLDILSRIASGLDGMTKRLSAHMQGNATKRFAVELLVEIRRFHDDTSTNKVPLSVSVNELASRTGMARETVSRQLTALKNMGLVTKKGRTLIVLDKEELQAYVDSAQ